MRFLVTTHAQPRFLPPTLVQPDEIVAGPNYNTVVIDGVVRFLGTPANRWDIRPLLAKLPPAQHPEAVLVHADSTMGCTPVSFPAGLPRILLVGDTHHLDRPLRRLLQYASECAFNAIVCWNRQHAHFFCEAGFQHVFWMPGLTFGIPEVSHGDERRRCISFFGQIGKYHPRRQRLVAAVQEAGLPFLAGAMPRREGLELFGQSLIAFNCSLNGEFNLRVFEATSMGAMVLTDRLAPHSGLDLFFKDGESIVCYDGPEDLVEKARHYLAHAEEALAIARRGEAVYRSLFTSEARRVSFMGILQHGRVLREYLLAGEPRCRLKSNADPQAAALLRARVALYEWAQERHRASETLGIHCMGNVPPQAIADLSDLSRARISLSPCPGQDLDPRLADAALSLGGRFECTSPALPGGDLLLTEACALGHEPVLEALVQARYQALFIWDLPEASRQSCEQELAGLGLARVEGVPGLFASQAAVESAGV